MWTWFVDNSGAVQALGTIIGIGIAIYVPWRQHRNGVALAEKLRREQNVERMETAASIAIHAMNLIQDAWSAMVKDRSASQGYILHIFSPGQFVQAEKALYEVNLSELPHHEMVRPILELRRLVISAAELVENIARREGDPGYDTEEARHGLDRVHYRANQATANIEALVNELRETGSDVKDDGRSVR